MTLGSPVRVRYYLLAELLGGPNDGERFVVAVPAGEYDTVAGHPGYELASCRVVVPIAAGVPEDQAKAIALPMLQSSPTYFRWVG